MPKPPNKALRLLAPVVMAVVGVAIAIAFFRNTQQQQQKQGVPQAAGTPASAGSTGTPNPTPAPASAPAQPGPKVAEQEATPASTGDSAAAGSEAQPSGERANSPPAPNGQLDGLRAVTFPSPTPETTLGGLDPKGVFRARALISPVGAGLRELALTDHFDTISREHNLVVQRERTLGDGSATLTPFAALAVRVGPVGGVMQTVVLAGSTATWAPVASAQGAFEAFVENSAGERVLRIERRFQMGSGVTDLRLHQTLTNLTTTPLAAQFIQMGPVDLAADAASYGGDKRRLRFGFLLNAKSDPSRSQVVADTKLQARTEVLGNAAAYVDAKGSQIFDTQGRPMQTFADAQVWPTERSRELGHDLVWVGLTNRYFGVTAHPLIDPAAPQIDKRLAWAERIDRVVLPGAAGEEVMALRLESRVLELAPSGGRADLGLGVFAGPLDRSVIMRDPALRALGVGGMVVHNFGGFCAPCTFEGLTRALLGLLRLLHDWIFHDWSLAIVFLVVIVRSLLHPVTRWSQIKMARFGKQMAAMAPKQKQLQEKFGTDPKRLQQETAKLWKEEGISPAGFLGCLPAFLQTPVWIALYAVIYWSVELRHQAAFYGIFQKIQPTSWPTWQFLADLGESDRFIYFGRVIFNAPMLGPIDSINILPIILGAVFFVQQKYLTPTTSTAMTPEQELQQKMMKWMMVVLWPLFMYNAPAALSVYFIANSTLAIFESKWIRSHMDKHGMLDLDKMKAERAAKKARESVVVGRAKGPEGEGFMAKLQRMAEEKQRESQKSAKRRK